jgi:tetratricopeptide (TPR) repeat protein
MHPELLNNPTFLRYNEMWQRDPKSLVFAPLADFFCQYKLYADARKVCEAGVKHNPNSVLAHFSLAKAYLSTREWHAARHEAQWVIARVSKHQGALDVLRQVDRHQVPVRHMIVQPDASAPQGHAPRNDGLIKVIEKAGGSSLPTPKAPGKILRKPIPWQTVTMAKIYSQQGLYFKARTTYKAILSRDPHNAEAQAGLATLERTMRDAAA